MQSTGLHDNNGVEIFDGDIVRLQDELHLIKFEKYRFEADGFWMNWQDDRMNADFFEYLPSNYWYQALELSDEAISFLIHAFAIRGMNGVIIHGDALKCP